MELLDGKDDCRENEAWCILTKPFVLANLTRRGWGIEEGIDIASTGILHHEVAILFILECKAQFYDEWAFDVS